MARKKEYRNRSNLKASGVQLDWTPDMIKEYIKCRDDIYYFIEKYYLIITEDGLEHMILRDYQKEMIESMVNNRFTLAVFSRQSGKTECFRAFLIWYILFNDFKTVAVVANKEDSAKEIINKLQISYRNLPPWLQLGVIDFNKETFVLENNSRIFASATTKDALRSYTVHVIIVDEAAHVDNWDEFYAAISPTISAGKNTKMIMSSTPLGMNHFYDFYEASSLRNNTNGYHGIFVSWEQVPGRDQSWWDAELHRNNDNYMFMASEYSCSFIGSSSTLIDGGALKILKSNIKPPIQKIDDLLIYNFPIKGVKKEIYETTPKGQVKVDKSTPGHIYSIVADVSRGKGLDYSAFSVFDITSIPYKQVAVYRNNEINPTDYAAIIHKTAQFYNNAIVLPEINDIGEQIGYLLLDKYGYDSLLCTSSKAGRGGKHICYNSPKADKGVRTTPPLKLSGCLLLKLLIEQRKLIIEDLETVNELLVFIKDKSSYKADKGKHDDLVMTLVLFAWMTDQEYFKELTNIDTMLSLAERNINQMESQLLPFGFIVETPYQNFTPYSHIYNLNVPWNPFTQPFYDNNGEFPTTIENAFELLK